ncbi:RluA family pseudouridine synthase [Lentisphaerota bacterium WC36G]|nr:RluA family pseudouridine synthase [Lentisphaerae bacterium WC36]
MTTENELNNNSGIVPDNNINGNFDLNNETGEYEMRYKIGEEFNGMRLDLAVVELVKDYSRSWVQKAIKNGRVILNNRVEKSPKFKITSGINLITVVLTDNNTELQKGMQPENIPLEVIFEDEHLIVINKPPAMVVHPAAGNYSGTLVNGLLNIDGLFSPDISLSEGRPGIVHRLDKDTSGCIVVAKNAICQARLMKLFAERRVKKAYAAVVCNWPHLIREELRTLIGRHPVSRKKMAVVDRNGKEAITEYELLQTGKIDEVPFSLLKVKIKTGRTHQIRVHLSSKNLPIAGDEIYGGKQKIEFPRQMLHAWRLEFLHPITGRKMRFRADFPEDFQNVLDSFKESEYYNELEKVHSPLYDDQLRYIGDDMLENEDFSTYDFDDDYQDYGIYDDDEDQNPTSDNYDVDNEDFDGDNNSYVRSVD